MPLVALSGITKTYVSEHVSAAVLHGIDLTIEAGEFVSLMGASGSGKSTLMHIIGLLDKPSSGSYMFAGRNVATMPDVEVAAVRNQEIGFVFQAFHLLARATVLENVMLPLQYSNIPRRQWQELAEQALSQVNMGHRLGHLPTQISGGEKQRVAIARALIINPKLILADEPTGNLDSKTGQNVLELISNLHAQGHTVVLVTHELEAARTAKRILTIKDGHMASDEPVVAAASSPNL